MMHAILHAEEALSQCDLIREWFCGEYFRVYLARLVGYHRPFMTDLSSSLKGSSVKMKEFLYYS